MLKPCNECTWIASSNYQPFCSWCCQLSCVVPFDKCCSISKSFSSIKILQIFSRPVSKWLRIPIISVFESDKCGIILNSKIHCYLSNRWRRAGPFSTDVDKNRSTFNHIISIFPVSLRKCI